MGPRRGRGDLDRLRKFGGGAAGRDGGVVRVVVTPLLFQRAVGEKDKFEGLLRIQLHVGLPRVVVDHVQRVGLTAPAVEVAHDVHAAEAGGGFALESVAQGAFVEGQDEFAVERSDHIDRHAFLRCGAVDRQHAGLEAGAAVFAAGQRIDHAELDVAAVGKSEFGRPNMVIDHAHGNRLGEIGGQHQRLGIRLEWHLFVFDFDRLAHPESFFLRLDGFGFGRGGVRGFPLVTQLGEIDHAGFHFGQTEDLRAVRRQAYGDLLRAVGAKVLSGGAGEFAAVFRIVRIEQEIPLAGLGEGQRLIFDRLAGEVDHHVEVVLRSSRQVAAEGDQLAPLIGGDHAGVGAGQGGTLVFEVAAQVDQIAVQLERVKRIVAPLPVERVVIVELFVLEQFLSHEKQRHARRGQREHGGQRGLAPGGQAAGVVFVDVGDDAAVAIEASGLVVVLRVDDAAEAEVGGNATGDVLHLLGGIGGFE